MHTAPSARRVSLWAAYGIAAAVLLGGGVGYRAAAERLARTGPRAVIAPGDLARLPLTIGAWRGRDEAMDQRVAFATDADALLNRLYAAGGRKVTLYVAGGVRARDMMPHRPEVCYPSNGWTLQDSVAVEVRLFDGAVLPCRVYTFGQGGLSGRSVGVLNYYIVDGRYSQDVSTLRSRARRGSSGVRYVTQVQVSCPAVGYGAEDSSDTLKRFIEQAGPLIRRLMPDGASSTASAPAEGPGGPAGEPRR